MKKTKIALTLVCAILLVAASVMGTLAYLTSTTGPVTNTFTVGENVAITLDEADVDEYGNQEYTMVDGEKKENDRVTENTYKLMPGHEYKKDPTVHVTGEDCYVFVTVSNGISDIEASTNTIASQMAAKGWKAVDATNYPGVYVYATGSDTKTVVKATTDLVVFEKFVVDSTQTNTGLNEYSDAEITVTAYAIQADGFANVTPATIWKDNFYVAPTTPEGDA